MPIVRRGPPIAFTTFMLYLTLPDQVTAQQLDTTSGIVKISGALGNEIVRLTTTMVVPRLPQTEGGTVFLWPGLQPAPGYTNFEPIGNGVLQSVLSWGPSCAPDKNSQRPDGWWISSQYVHDEKNAGIVGFIGCFGGPLIGALPQDKLLIDMSLVGSIWTQTVLNLRSHETTAFGVDLRRQAQAFAIFNIEVYDGARSPDVQFLETTVRFKNPDPQNCSLQEQGIGDRVSAPVLAGDMLSCSIAVIALSTK